jgi:hypothetical protein
MTQSKMQTLVAPAPYNISGAFGNGYVIVSKNSPLYGKDYNDAIFNNVEVNGGMTYANAENERLGLGGDGWVFGFDTQHNHDNAAMWPDEQSVLDECDRLRKQLEKIEQRLVRKQLKAQEVA